MKKKHLKIGDYALYPNEDSIEVKIMQIERDGTCLVIGQNSEEPYWTNLSNLIPICKINNTKLKIAHLNELIDMSLLIGDKEWFIDLTSELNSMLKNFSEKSPEN